MKTKPPAIETIEAATIPATPVNPALRSATQKERSAAIWRLLYSLGIRNVSVTSAKGSMCFWTYVRFDRLPCPTRGDDGHASDTCPICSRASVAVARLRAIILAAFPDMDDRSDTQSDHFDFMFTIDTCEPKGELAAHEPGLEPVATVKLGAPEPARPALALVPAEPIRAAQPESEPDYQGGGTYAPGTIPVFAPKTEPGRFLGNAADVWTACRDLDAEKREHFVVFFLDVRHRMIGDRWTMAIGSLTGVEVHPRELFREAIIRSAAAILVVHNHPSNDPTPSRQDIELTSRIRQVGDLVGIALLDHVIVAAEDGFVSLAGRGWC